MAFKLEIRQKKLFGKTGIAIEALAKACGLGYGSDNEFHILMGEQESQGTAIFYNPYRVGRGIFFDGSKGSEGFYRVSYNIPTTKTEIADFTRLVQEIERRLGKVEMYCPEEGRLFTCKELEEGIDRFARFSLKSLNDFCGNKEYRSYILTLAMWPYTLPEDKVAAWQTCTDLSDFEQTIHVLQCMDVYYAKPRLMQKSDTEEIGAFYALTEDCESVFPVRGDGFLNMDGIRISECFVQFVLHSERRVLEGLFPYDRFMEALQQYNIRPFDGDHVLIPPMSKAQLEELAARLR